VATGNWYVGEKGCKIGSTPGHNGSNLVSNPAYLINQEKGKEERGLASVFSNALQTRENILKA
jgi:hypothetical protein